MPCNTLKIGDRMKLHVGPTSGDTAVVTAILGQGPMLQYVGEREAGDLVKWSWRAVSKATA